MPTVNGSTYFDKKRGRTVRKPSGLKYYDTNSGSWFRTYHQYRQRKNIRETGRTYSQNRRAKEKAKRTGRKVRQRKPAPPGMQTVGGRRVQTRRRFYSTEKWIVYAGSKARIQTVLAGRRNQRGILQIFYVGGDNVSPPLGGSPGIGPNPTGPGYIEGFWATVRRRENLGAGIADTETIDPDGVGYWRVLVEA